MSLGSFGWFFKVCRKKHLGFQRKNRYESANASPASRWIQHGGAGICAEQFQKTPSAKNLFFAEY
jgi:hypothetical protein